VVGFPDHPVQIPDNKENIMSKHINEAIERVLPTQVAEVLRKVDREITDETFPLIEQIIGLHSVENFTKEYEGSNKWILKMQGQLAKYGSLTVRQRRSVAEIARKSLRKEPDPRTSASLSTDPESRTYTCFTCKKEIVGRTALYEHKKLAHGEGRYGRLLTGKPAEERPVLEGYEPKLNLDLTPIPDGRFAVFEDDTSKAIYLYKRTLKKRSTQYGKFVWTKYRYAREHFYPGDILARKISGDTKEFIGHQRKGKPFYSGEYEEAWAKVLADPVSAMKLYGKLVNACAYCGRTLTDPLSQERGIGPDCWENKHIPAFGWGHPSYMEKETV
jgi:hypothetical protein